MCECTSLRRISCSCNGTEKPGAAGGGGNNNRAPRNDFAFLAFLPWPATAKQPDRRDRASMGGHPGHLHTHASPPPPAHSVGVSGQHGPPSHGHQVPRWKQTSRLSVFFFPDGLGPSSVTYPSVCPSWPCPGSACSSTAPTLQPCSRACRHEPMLGVWGTCCRMRGCVASPSPHVLPLTTLASRQRCTARTLGSGLTVWGFTG